MVSYSVERPKGPLQVSDDFSVLDDPVEQKEFTEWVDVDGRQVAFDVRAHDEHAVISTGTHARVVVDRGRFVSRLPHPRP